jgi:hypothetical protein
MKTPSFKNWLLGISFKGLLFVMVSCEKEDLTRDNVLDISGIYSNSAFGYPVIADGSVSGVYANGAEFDGKVFEEGIGGVIERGVCYNYSGNPSLSYYRISAGSGAGDYTCTFSGLLPGFTYYLRAYAKNQKGVAYGQVLSFTTPIQ